MILVLALLPLNFEPNQGQADVRAQFLARGAGYVVALRSTGASVRLDRSAVEMRFAGGNPLARAEALDPQPSTSNYFIGQNPAAWRVSVQHYARVRYQQVYPGVDVLYYGNGRELEYDFVLAPAADPRRIRIKVNGSQTVRIDANGDLILETPGGNIRQRRPVVYQSSRRRIECRYALVGRNAVELRVGRYNSKEPLVIDPVLSLSYSTNIGNARAQDAPSAMAVDASGSAYITGTTLSPDFPTTPGAFQSSRALARTDLDVFVTKLTPRGDALIYSTYLGGTDVDSGSGIAVDAFGSAYVTGFTRSKDFPVTVGAYQSVFPGNTAQAFVTKLNASGSALIYSTYLGGTVASYNGTTATGIALDTGGNAYLTGYTDTPDFPITPGAWAAGKPPGGFVTKLNPTGTALVYSAFGAYLAPAALALNSARNAYVTGGVAANGLTKVFVMELNATGSEPVYLDDFIGGSDYNSGAAIAIDSTGSAYVTGVTVSTDFPTTPGAFQKKPGGGECGGYFGGQRPCRDAFIFKLNPDGTAFEYSSYLGGTGDDEGRAIAVDSAGEAYVVGSTAAPDFPTVIPLQNSGTSFLTKMDAAGTGLIYSTYLSTQYAVGVALDSLGSAYTVAQSGAGNISVSKIELLPGPHINAPGVVNAASFLNGPVAPGELVTIFGAGIGPVAAAGLQLDSSGLVASSLSGVQVFFDGTPAPLLYVQANQVNTIVPYAVAGQASTRIKIENQGVLTNEIELAVAGAAPAIFTMNSTGRGQGAILNQDSSINSPDRPALQNSIVAIYATGAGRTDPQGVDGKLATQPLAKPMLSVSVRIGELPAEVLYGGAAPGLVAGVLQVNVRVPADAPTGNAVPVSLTIGDFTGPPLATIAIRVNSGT